MAEEKNPLVLWRVANKPRVMWQDILGVLRVVAVPVRGDCDRVVIESRKTDAMGEVSWVEIDWTEQQMEFVAAMACELERLDESDDA